MQQLSIIAAIDEAGGLGINNHLLAHLPADLAYFKQQTVGKPIIMGRKTYESIGRALPGRTNVVVSCSLTGVKQLIVVSSLDDAIRCVSTAPEIMIIGGAQIYKQALPLVTRLYLTRIHYRFNADVFFPSFDNKQEWVCIKEQYRAKDELNNYDMTFHIYERKQ